MKQLVYDRITYCYWLPHVQMKISNKMFVNMLTRWHITYEVSKRIARDKVYFENWEQI